MSEITHHLFIVGKKSILKYLYMEILIYVNAFLQCFL